MKGRRLQPAQIDPSSDQNIGLIEGQNNVGLTNVLERITAALWRAHGDYLAEILARRGVTTLNPGKAVSPSSKALDLDEPF